VKSISLVCTVHGERGQASIAELLAILNRIQPEVIFLELPTNALDHFFNTRTKSNLESAAVRLYLESKRAELVPVDLPQPEDEFFNDYRYLQTAIDNHSSDSRRLFTWHRNYVREHGFSYLNSEHCSNMWSDIYSDELATIQRLGDPNLKRISDQWSERNDLRENEMLKNIALSCKTKSFGKAVFLIGAAHRQSIINKSKRYSDEAHDCIRWDFSCGTN